MKKIILLILLVITLTGCGIKRDSMEDITIYTSVYPIEFITESLYDNNSTIKSIYPDGVIPEIYTINEKQIKDFSKGNLFIFNGLSNEKDFLKQMLLHNKNLKIIDATSSMEYNKYNEELWLDPDNMIMMARNIKSGFNEYINNHYLKNEIEKNYDQLKIDLSNLSAKLRLTSSSSQDPTIVVSSDMFLFLKKYGYNVISLDEKTVTEKTIVEAKKRIANGTTKNIFIIKGYETSETIKNIINETNCNTIEIHSLSTITEIERTNKKDYISIMTETINSLKQEIYK